MPSLAGNRFARRLRSVEQVERILDAPVLAQIPHLNVRSGGLQTVAGESERSRALRRLRDNVVVLTEATGARTLLVCGPSGRQGKGIVVAGLALGLAEADASVVAVEADSRRASLTQLLGVVAPPLGLAELLLGEIADEAAQTAVYSGAGAEFRLVSAGGARLPEGGLGSARMRELLASLAARHAHVLVSGPALLEQEDAVDLAALCDGVVLVVRNEQTTTAETEEARALLARVGAPVLGAVFTDTAEMRDRSARPAELRARVAAQPAAAGADAAAAGEEARLLEERAAELERQAAAVAERESALLAAQAAERARPAVPEPLPAPTEDRPTDFGDPQAGRWRYAALQRTAVALASSEPERAEELGFYLEALRRLVDSEGLLPPSVDSLVRQKFAGLLPG